MPWEPSERELLSRCVTDARAGTPVNSGQLSRFYKALAGCPSLTTPEPPGADLKLCGEVLSVAGRPPLDASRRAESTLHTLARSSLSADVRAKAARALADYWRDHRPTHASHASELAAHEALGPNVRIDLALAANTDESIRLAAGLLPDSSLPLDRLKAIHEWLVAMPGRTQAHGELLEELYASGSWLGRRILLKGLGPDHAFVIPTLARVAARADPTTRRSVVAALGRIGHVGAEPILVTLLGEVEQGVLLEVLGVLATLGTRASLPGLSQARERHPGLLDAIDATIAAIDERHPVDAAAGALSLVEAGAAGALSLTGASPGDVSLYRSVEGVVSQAALTPARAETAPAGMDDWVRLVSGPRAIPAAFWLWELGVGKLGVSLMGWCWLAFWIHIAAESVAALVVLCAGFGLIALASWQGVRREQLLRDGTPTFATMTSHALVTDARNRVMAHDYTFEYMDESEQVHAATIQHELEQKQYTVGSLQPILYDHDHHVLAFGDLGYLGVCGKGTLTASSPRYLLGVLGPAVTLYALGSLWLEHVL